MVRCFLTGVELTLENALVLNRRDARDLLAEFQDRVASLRRLIEQLSPLDEEDGFQAGAHSRGPRPARKKHRLVCKAVADALAPGFPEVRLFLCWPEYHARVRLATLHGLRGHPLFGGAIKALDDAALREAGTLARGVLYLLDRHYALPRGTRHAISVGTCVRHRGRSAQEVVQLIRRAAAEAGDPDALGLTKNDLHAIQTLTGIGTSGAPAQPQKEGGSQ